MILSNVICILEKEKNRNSTGCIKIAIQPTVRANAYFSHLYTWWVIGKDRPDLDWTLKFMILIKISSAIGLRACKMWGWINLLYFYGSPEMVMIIKFEILNIFKGGHLAHLDILVINIQTPYTQ